MNALTERLRYHVTGAIERGESEPIVECSPRSVLGEYETRGMTAVELLHAVDGWHKPDGTLIRRAVSADGTAIAGWYDGDWHMVAGLMIDSGGWAPCSNLRVNGELAQPGPWTEVFE